MYLVNANVNLIVEICNSSQKWKIINANTSAKNMKYMKKDYILNPATCIYKNCKYLASIIYNSIIMCDEIIDAVATKTVPTIFNEKIAICKTQKFYILLVFLLMTIALLIPVSVYCYPIKYWAK